MEHENFIFNCTFYPLINDSLFHELVNDKYPLHSLGTNEMIFFLINNTSPLICKNLVTLSSCLASEKRESTTKDYRLVIFCMSEFIPQFSYLLILFYFIVVIVIGHTIYSYGNANKLINRLIDIFIPTDILIHWKNLTKFLFYSLRNFE